MQHYFKLMRIHHYIKNLLVFAALACSGQLLVLEKAKIGTIGFALGVVLLTISASNLKK